jgi:hypothetical protein
VSRPDTQLITLLRLNLLSNDFIFNNKVYLQISGTAMGKRFAPSYANIYMADFENKALAGYYLKPIIWLRYIDDIFGIWGHSKEELMNFYNYLNHRSPSIKLTISISEDKVTFLDMTIKKAHMANGIYSLETAVSFKLTDLHRILPRRSFHPKFYVSRTCPVKKKALIQPVTNVLKFGNG